ncbi:MAG: serine hydrolase domain-containing protein, partial [Sphingomonadaceae bacterium]
MIRLLLALLLLPAAFPCQAGEPLARAEVEAFLDGLLPAAMAQGGIPGAVVVVVHAGETLVAKGYGLADTQAQRPVDAERTLFRPGSISKLYVATAVLQHAEAGRLDLDADIQRYLDFPIPERPDGPITLRHLLTHTAGFEERYRNLFLPEGEALPPLREELARHVPRRIYAAGAMPAYSNYGSALAGHIVASAAGMPFEAYVEHFLLEPIGAQRTSFRQPLPPALAADVATGYPHRGASARPFETVGLPPAGALSTTGADLARFMIAHLDEGGPLLKPQTAALMQQTASRPLPPLAGMALGYFVLREEKPRILEHGGATGVARASLWLFPETRTGIAILTNSPGKSEAAVRLFQALLQGFLARWHPEANAMPPVTAGSAASAVAGRYLPTRRSGRGIARAFGFSQAVSITASSDGALRTSRPTAPDGEPMIFRPVADGLWQDAESGRRL